MIHIYYGYGKGKTSAATGAGIRAYGAGKSVFLAQFLKDSKSSELSAVPFEVFKAPESLPFNPDSSYRQWVLDAVAAAEKSKADMLILDELLDVIPEFLSLEEALGLLKKDCEIIITGHKVIEPLFEKADYVTHMEKIKHPYDKGVKARRGIEY